MQTVATIEQMSEQEEIKEVPEAGMEQKSQGFSITNIAVSILALLLGIVGGLLASVASNSEWKGKVEQRITTLENQRMEDKVTWEYIRTQNEVNGRSLTRIEASLDASQKRR